LQNAKIDIGFLGTAQIDRFGNLNSTVIGPYRHPTTRLPGGGGAPEIAAACSQSFALVRHSPRAFVQRLDFRTTIGGGDGPSARGRLGLRGPGVTAVISDLGVLEPTRGQASWHW
jgi:glutaconate CoA-transferase subunit B